MTNVLPPYAETVRRADPDRFLAALFAPPAKRDALLLLTAFNHEIARAREVASQPMLALIRLQWWREVVVDGVRRSHEVAAPLGLALDAGTLHGPDLAAMIDARETETEETIPTIAAWDSYVDGTAGAYAAAAGRLLGADGPTRDRLRRLGTAYGVAGQIRSVGVLARHQRCLLPIDLLAAHGLDSAAVLASPSSRALDPVVTTLAAHGRAALDESRGPVPRDCIAAALPAVFAARDLANPTRPPRPRGLTDRLAVMLAGLRARV